MKVPFRPFIILKETTPPDSSRNISQNASSYQIPPKSPLARYDQNAALITHIFLHETTTPHSHPAKTYLHPRTLVSILFSQPASLLSHTMYPPHGTPPTHNLQPRPRNLNLSRPHLVPVLFNPLFCKREGRVEREYDLYHGVRPGALGEWRKFGIWDFGADDGCEE
jgi:hypothetical protein